VTENKRFDITTPRTPKKYEPIKVRIIPINAEPIFGARILFVSVLLCNKIELI
jgi:hypothetical protein